jgi:hypothetical protein
MRNYRQREAQEINCSATEILVRFPGYVLYIPYLEEGHIYFFKISKRMHEMNTSTMAISEMVILGVLLLARK